MKLSLPQSLKFRTILRFLVASLVPLILVGAAAWSRIESDLVEEIVRAHLALVRQVRLNVEGAFEFYGVRLASLARRMDVQGMVTSRAQRPIRDYLDYNPVVSDVVLFDRSGQPLLRMGQTADASNVGTTPPLDESLRRRIDASAESHHRLVGHARPDARDVHEGRTLQYVSRVPSFLDPRQTVGYLSETIEVDRLGVQRMVDGWRFVENAVVFILGPGGRVVAGSGKDRTLRRVRLQAGSLQTATSSEIVVGRAFLLNAEQLVAYARIPDIDLGIVACKPYEQVHEFLPRLLRSIGLYVVLGVGLSVILGASLAQGLIRPILALTDGIEQAARGELAHRVEVDRADELGRASIAFNALASHLHKVHLLQETWRLRRSVERPTE